MTMDDRDWLDQRLASGTYLPDDGFTARVVGQLADTRARDLVRRQRILAVASVLALALVIVQIVPLIHDIQVLVAGMSLQGLVATVGTHAHDWIFQAGAAGVMTLVALGSVALVRRWS
jgi:hypothetical protein